MMEFHTVFGLVWDDEEQMYALRQHYYTNLEEWARDGAEKPKSMTKEVTHYAHATNTVDVNGIVLTKSIFEFDNFRVLEEL